MIGIQAIISNEAIYKIVQKHINKKTADLITWYIALKKPSTFLPDGFPEGEAEEVIRLLQDAVQSEETVELNDHRLQFALSCILEEEEKVTDVRKGLSAEFSDNDRRGLEKYLPEEEIRYLESYDHFRDLLIPDTGYLDIAMKNSIR